MSLARTFCTVALAPLLAVFAMHAMAQGRMAQESMAQENSPETEAGWQGVQFRRWSPIVANVDETIYLYTEILGFTLSSLTVDEPDSYVFEVFNIPRDTKTRHATFDRGEQKRVLSVVEVPGVKSPSEPGDVRMSAVLLNADGHFDEIVAKLRAQNYQVLTPHRLGQSGIEIGFIDRDGHVYAMYQIPYTGNMLDQK